MQVAIIANGSILNYPKTKERLTNFDRIIAADGGLLHCKSMAVMPDLVIGDMDSISEEELLIYSNCEKVTFPKDKDKTDLELAVEKALKDGTNSITLFGALGRRIDHSISNLQLLCRHPEIITIESQYETIHAIANTQIIRTSKNQTVSLFSISANGCTITTKGLKWDVENTQLNERFMSISNVCPEGKFEIIVHDGIALCSLCS